MFMKNVKDKNQSFSSLAVSNHKGFDPDVPEISDSDNNDTYIFGPGQITPRCFGFNHLGPVLPMFRLRT